MRLTEGIKILVAGTIIFLAAGSAYGQEAQETQHYAKPRAESRIGVDTSKRIRMTLREAVELALENNRDIAIERENVRLNEWDIKGAMGVYDPMLTGSFAFDHRNLPVTSIFGAGQSTNIGGSLNYQQKLMNNFGSSIQATLDNTRASNNNAFNDLNPTITTNLNVTFIQPLMRGRKVDGARRAIRLTKKRLDLSDSQFRQRAIEIIAQVQRAYWDLVFARRDQEIKKDSVENGLVQLEHNQRLVEAGSLAPADVISTKVDVDRRIDDLEAASEVIQRAENALKALILQPSNTDYWGALIEPTDKAEIGPEIVLPLRDAVQAAFKSRPELEQFRMRGELNEIDTEYYRDQAKPQVDFFTTYGSSGLAGSLQTLPNPLSVSNQILYGRINQLSALAGLPAIGTGGFGSSVNPDIVGSYPTSVLSLLRNDFRTVRFGVNISLPIRNRAAKAQLGRIKEEGRQIDIQKQRAMQGIEVEVRNALQGVETARRRVDAAASSRKNAELQLASEQRKFDAGQSTNFFVLDRQNALSAAQGRELRALTDYNKAIAEMQRAISSTLTSNNIQISNAETGK